MSKDQLTIKNLRPILVTACQSIFLYLAIIIPTEYLLTEQWLILKKIEPQSKTLALLLVSAVLFSFKFWVNKGANKVSHKKLLIWIVVLLVGLGGNYLYRQHYRYLQQFPRIYSLSTDWSIQGMKIKIEGKNFGSPSEPGQVMVNDFKLLNHKWSNQEVIVEQPVPERYFQGDLVLKNADGKASQAVEFEIRDPAELN
jgi:hypothetical protein